MAEATGTAPGKMPEARMGLVRSIMRATDVDTRLLGMVAALAILWIGFHVLSNGIFLTPRNLWNLSVQTSSVAIMATGMVLVIVSRNIDLSVGSLLAFVGMVMGTIQVNLLPQLVGFDFPLTWIITLTVGIALGALIGAVHGYIVAYLAIPAFIVTLGGLLVWRGAAWWVASGQTIAPLDSTFRILGGAPNTSIGATASWFVGVFACLGIAAAIISGRRQRRKFNFPLRPMWAEISLGGIGCAAVLGAISVANSYPWPKGLARQ